MKLRREFKIGVFAVIVLLVAWWGIKWLGGRNLLKTTNIYYAYYDDVTGLMESSRVWMRGVDVGNVRSIELLGEKVKVEIAVESQYEDMIRSNAVAEIGSSGLMGGQQISIIQGDAAEPLAPGAEMIARVNGGLMGMLADKGGELMEGLDQTLDGVNDILATNAEGIAALVANLESMSASIDRVLASGEIDGAINDLHTFTSTLAENTGRIESMLQSLDTFTGDLAGANLVSELEGTVASLNGVLSAIEDGQGSVGMLLNDNGLYDSLNDASENLSLLLADLKQNPMRYVHFSLFGTSEEKLAERAAKREARAEKRAERRAEKE